MLENRFKKDNMINKKLMIKLLLGIIISFIFSKIDIKPLDIITAQCLTFHPLIVHSQYDGSEIITVRKINSFDVAAVAEISHACTFFYVFIGCLFVLPSKCRTFFNIINLFCLIFLINQFRLFITFSLASVGCSWWVSHNPIEWFLVFFVFLYCLTLNTERKSSGLA